MTTGLSGPPTKATTPAPPAAEKVPTPAAPGRSGAPSPDAPTTSTSPAPANKTNGVNGDKAEKEKSKKNKQKEKKEREKAEKEAAKEKGAEGEKKESGVASPAAANGEVSTPVEHPSAASPQPGSEGVTGDGIMSPRTDSTGARTPTSKRAPRNPWTLFIRLPVPADETALRDFFQDAKDGVCIYSCKSRGPGHADDILFPLRSYRLHE